MADWKLTKVKVLNRYSVEESEKYDLKLYVEFTRRGFWFFSKKGTIKLDVYRCNTYHKSYGGRYFSTKSGGGLCQFSYVLPNGEYLDNFFNGYGFGRQINEHFQKMYRIRYDRAERIKRMLDIPTT